MTWLHTLWLWCDAFTEFQAKRIMIISSPLSTYREIYGSNLVSGPRLHLGGRWGESWPMTGLTHAGTYGSRFRGCFYVQEDGDDG